MLREPPGDTEPGEKENTVANKTTRCQGWGWKWAKKGWGWPHLWVPWMGLGKQMK